VPDVSGVLDITQWKWTLPEGSAGKPEEVQGADLTSYAGTWLTRVGNCLICSAPVNGITTSGSDNPRSEGRQIDPKTGKGAAWQPGTGWNSLTVTEAFTKLPDGKPEVVGAQIHNATDDVTVWRLEGTKLYVTSGNDDHWKLADANYQLGTPFLLQFIVANNIVYAYYNGGLVGALPVSGTDYYWKVGAYVQANCSDDGVRCATDNVGEVTLYSVKVESGTGQAPAPTQPNGAIPAPLPVTDPTPPVVVPPTPAAGPIVILRRHAEKPAGSLKGYTDPSGTTEDSHSLTLLGWQRAQGLVPLFTVPRSDLFVPTRIYAADGPSAGDRMKETVSFLAADLGITVDLSHDKGDESGLVTDLKALAPDEVALVCWEHTNAAVIAKAFGQTITWPDADFNGLLIFTGDGNGGWTFQQTAELVLPTDKAIGLDGKTVTVGTMPAPPVVVDPPPAQDPPPVVVDPPVTDPPPSDPPVVTPPADPPVEQPPADPQPAPSPNANSWWARFIGWLLSWWN
jgi:Alginate lyase